MNADGTKVSQLTDNVDLTSLAMTFWSPDGDQIAFTTWRNGGSVIFVMNADGTNVSQLTDNDGTDGFDRGASWSPDSKRIAFASDRDGESEIFVMNADGTNTYSTGQKGWSPSFGG
jgi:TolB protein